MTVDERQAFLALPWVGVLSIADPGRGPLSVPVWYLYEPGGELRIWTGRKTRKAALLQSAGRISLCVQDPKSPYRYVTVEGPYRLGPVDFEREVRPLAYRYLGSQRGEAYLGSLGGPAGVAGDLLVCLKPEHWLSVDYTKVVLLPE
jgi:hypothetical protein